MLLKACGENLRDRAFVHTFSDLACRLGEILSHQIKHVKFDDRGAARNLRHIMKVKSK